MKAKISIITTLLIVISLTKTSISRNYYPELPLVHGTTTVIDSLNSSPANLLDFSVDTLGTSVKVSWLTKEEKRNSYYVVQRSADGKSYENIIWIEGVGNRRKETEYSIIDSEAYFGTSYYRVVQTDSKGNFISYKTGVSKMSRNILLVANNDLTIKKCIKLNITSNVHIDRSKLIISDETGKELFSEVITEEFAATNSINIPGGKYFFKIIDDNRIIQSGYIDLSL